MDDALAQLKRHLGEIVDLGRAQAVLHWDMEVFMPPTGGDSRAAQLATLAGAIHERQVDDRIGELLAEAETLAAALSAESDDACLVRVARRDWEKARRVPTELTAEFTRVQAQAYEAWVKAREAGDFASFRPWLERVLDLRLEYIECFAPYDDPYDVLLDDYEPGMRTDDVRAVFSRLEPELTALVSEHATDEVDPFAKLDYPVEALDRLSRELVERFGVTWDSFRLDTTVHPFATSFGLGDVRMTTRYTDEGFASLFTAMHECGHGLYEWGSSPTLDRTPLCGCESATLHESQSRLWENVVGRSLPFWRWFYPRLLETFPEQLGDVPLERFHRAVNRVQRSLVRVNADETSYGLHVILRFELEQELIAGRLAVADLPDAWNTRFEELLGIPVPDDRVGVLQDAHWAGGLLGYFPTYLLGSVVSVQIWERAKEAVPDVEEQLEGGEFGELHAWLRESLYALGSKFPPTETIERVAGGPIDPEPYLAYLRGKLGALQAA